MNIHKTRYYVNRNKQANGDNEVHKVGCSWFPSNTNAVYLGDFVSCHKAVLTARMKGYQANGCAHCSPDCHTT